MTSEKRRRYRSPLREQQARVTRRLVLDAAHQLFLDRGYETTTIDDIAAVARVSRPTVFTVGTKPELLASVRDRVIAGDDEPIAVPDRPPVAQMRAASDPESTLRIHARNVTAINSRYAALDEVLRRSTDSDPALNELWEKSERQRLDGATIVIDDVLRKGPLKADLDRTRAIEILWLLMAPDLYNRATTQGWTIDEYERWLAETLVSQLLPSAKRHD